MLQDQINEALQSLKEAKMIRNQKQEKRAMRDLIDLGPYGGLLKSIYNKFLCRYNINQSEKNVVINSAFYEIYKYVEKMDVGTDGRINNGLKACARIIQNQARQYVTSEITARGDGSPHKPTNEIRKLIKDLTVSGCSYQDIGFKLDISYEALIKNYKRELEIPEQEETFIQKTRRIKAYSLESRRIDIDEPWTASHKSSEKPIEDCMHEGFKSFAAEEVDRAYVIALKNPDVYDYRASFLKKAWMKFKGPVRIISKSQNMKLSSEEIGTIIGKKKANVDVYYNESNEKFKEYIKECFELITQQKVKING